MPRIVFMIALVVSTGASAVDYVRCGKDQFGNIVCFDKDGVLTAPAAAASGEGSGAAASGVSAAEAKARREEVEERLRCSVDPFGNKVCRGPIP